VPGEGLVFSPNRQGVNERYLIDAALLMRLWGFLHIDLTVVDKLLKE